MVGKLRIVIFSSIVVLLCGSIAYGLGSGGIRNEVVDAEAGGKGYCFTAQADGPSAVHYNPAGLTQLKGDYDSTGFTFEAPRSECESDATGDTVQMQKQTFIIPNFYYLTDLGSERFRFGFSATFPYGLSTDWAADSFSKNVMTESDVEMFNLNPAVALKINDKVSVGAGINRFSATMSKHKVLTLTGVGGLSDTGGDFQLKADDVGFGYNLGILVKPSNKQRIGVSYRSDIDLTYKGTATLDTLNAAYAGVFGGSTYTTTLESSGTIPQTLAVGYAYQPDDKWTIEVDIEWTDWSCVEEEMILFPDESDPTRLAVLNGGNPVSRDWNDVFAYGIGAEYKATDNLDLRCGLLYHESPIQSVNVDTPLPDANKHGVTLGLGYLFKEDVTIDVSYAFFKYRDRDVTNNMGDSTSSNINGTYKGYVNVLALGVTYKY